MINASESSTRVRLAHRIFVEESRADRRTIALTEALAEYWRSGGRCGATSQSRLQKPMPWITCETVYQAVSCCEFSRTVHGAASQLHVPAAADRLVGHREF